jgi:predicted acetyltransferase
MVQAIHNLRERGCYICPLWPSSYRWYGKFGWASPAPVLELKVWPDLVRQTKPAPGTLRQATSDDVMAVQRLYTEGARLRNGQSVRSEDFWLKEEILSQLWVLEGESSGLDCCALVKREDIRFAQGKKVTVRELHGATFASQLRLVRSLAELDRVVALNLELPAGSLFLQAFPERFDIAVKLTMGLRVLDVEQALAHLKPPDDLRAEVSFEVSDWVIDADKPLAVTAHAEEGHVEVSERAGKDALRCDVNTFTQLFAGGLTAADARELGRLEGGNPSVFAACDALLAGRVPYRSWIEAG